MKLSIVVPVRDEEGNLEALHKRLLKVCEDNLGFSKKDFEIIYVENASSDNSIEVLKGLEHAKTLVMRWQPYMRNAQSLAMDAGFKASTGEKVVYIDADLQVEPEEIPAFLEKLDEGYDVVCGWRQKRKETTGIDLLYPLKQLLRQFFIIFRHRLINEGVHDPGSALKAFKKEALEDLNLYGESHRYIVAMLKWQGYKITELPIKHFPRTSGKSKYNITKGFRGFADLISVFVWRKYTDRPLHLFGVSGLFLGALGSAGLGVLLVLRFFEIISLSNSIWPILFILLIISGVQLFIGGIITDRMARIYYSQTEKTPYKIKEVISN